MLVAGDVYDLSAPSARPSGLVVQALLRLRDAGAEVIVIAGNHDHGPTFEAYRPLMGVAGITLAGTYRAAERGGVIRFTARSDGADAQVAVLPFLSQRYAVRAAEIVANTPSENVRAYDEQVREVIGALTGGFGDDTVNLVMSHITCLGGTFGGGERSAQSIFEYSVPASIFPITAHYVALGHLHRRQALAGARPGALQRRTAGGGLRRAGQHQRRLPGRGDAGHAGPDHRHPDHVRAAAADRARHRGGAGGAGRRVRRRLPAGLPARADPRRAARGHRRRCCPTPWRCGSTRNSPPRRPSWPGPPSRAPRGRRAELFADYCATRDVSDPRVAALFGELHDEVTATDGAECPRRAEPGKEIAVRPITLDLHGFASFREEAHVDFGDADYFALVGPTGSGKSTVIDAMTFALYGSVPRWGRKGMVSIRAGADRHPGHGPSWSSTWTGSGTSSPGSCAASAAR